MEEYGRYDNTRDNAPIDSPSHQRRKRRLRRLLVLLGVFAALIPFANAAQAPGDIRYPLKRAIESASLAVTPGYKFDDGLRFLYATRRVREALVIAKRIQDESAKKQIRDAERISALLQEYSRAHSEMTITFAQTIDEGRDQPPWLIERFEPLVYVTYANLEELRLLAPPIAQADVLIALQTMQQGLVTLDDSLHRTPVSPSDVKFLTELITNGFLTKEELTTFLGGITSNRDLVRKLRTQVREGTLPPDILFRIHEDQLAAVLPDRAPIFHAQVTFDELRKTALLLRSIDPTSRQSTAIKNFLLQYAVGQQLPRGDIRRFVAPLLYGIHLAQELPESIGRLDAQRLSPERRVLFDAWAPMAHASSFDSKTLFNTAMRDGGTAVARNADLLERIQLEILKALRSEVTYLALPTGWTGEDVVRIQDRFQADIGNLRKAEIAQAKTNTLVTTLADVAVPLVPPLTNQSLDDVRKEIKTSIERVRGQMIAHVFGASAVVAPSPSLPGSGITRGVLPTPPVTPPPLPTATPVTTDDIAALRAEFTRSLETLQGQLSALASPLPSALPSPLPEAVPTPPVATTAELAALKATVEESLAKLTMAHSQLETHAKDATAAQAALTQTIAGMQKAQTETAARLDASLASIQGNADITRSELEKSIADVKETGTANMTTLQAQLADNAELTNQIQRSLATAAITEAEQIAVVQAQLTLSDAERAALKTDVETTIADLNSDHAAAVQALTAALNEQGAQQDAAIAILQKTLADTTGAHNDLVGAVRAQADDTNALEGQVEQSLNNLRAAQAETAATVETLKTADAETAALVMNLAATQTKTTQQIAAHVAETEILRTQLETSIAETKQTYDDAQVQLLATLLSVRSEFADALADVRNAQEETSTKVASLGTDVVQVQKTLSAVQDTQLEIRTELTAQAETTAALKVQIAATFAGFAEAQAKLETDLAALEGNVGALQQTVSDIHQAQTATQSQVDALAATVAAWSTLPQTFQIDQTQLDAFKKELDDEFAAKLAILDQKFQQVQVQLDAAIARLRKETDEQLLRLQSAGQAVQTPTSINTSGTASTSTSTDGSGNTGTSVNVSVSTAPVATEAPAATAEVSTSSEPVPVESSAPVSEPAVSVGL